MKLKNFLIPPLQKTELRGKAVRKKSNFWNDKNVTLIYNYILAP